MIKAKDFQPELVTFGAIQLITQLSSRYCKKVFYDGQSMQVQLPQMLVSRAPYDLHGKFYTNVIFRER